MDNKECNAVLARYESALSTKINQYKMLSNTLEKILTNGGNFDAVLGIKNEMEETINEIRNIRAEIEAVNCSESVTYKYYDKSEDTNKGNLYDSISKEDIDVGKCIPKHPRRGKLVHTDSESFENKYIDEINKTADSRLLSNRFLVHFGSGIDIPEIMVKSVSFDPSESQLSISIYDFVMTLGGKSSCALKLLDDVPSSFNLCITHLDANGSVVYSEYYFGCSVEEVFRDPNDYSSTEFSTIQVLISYDKVRYETNKQE